MKIMYQVKYIMGNVMESDSIIWGTQPDVHKAPAMYVVLL
jgi:hypothetical protein